MNEEAMQACLEAGDLPGTPSEVKAIRLAYVLGIQACLAAVGEIAAESEAGNMILDAVNHDLRKLLATARHGEGDHD